MKTRLYEMMRSMPCFRHVGTVYNMLTQRKRGVTVYYTKEMSYCRISRLVQNNLPDIPTGIANRPTNRLGLAGGEIRRQ